MITPQPGSFGRKSNSAVEVSVAERLATGGFLSIDEVAQWLGISRGMLYKQVRAGDLKLSRIGKRSLVSAAAAIAYRDKLEAA